MTVRIHTESSKDGGRERRERRKVQDSNNKALPVSLSTDLGARYVQVALSKTDQYTELPLHSLGSGFGQQALGLMGLKQKMLPSLTVISITRVKQAKETSR